ncbi:MAG: nucleoside triphosphate pyrophosphohydrolase, partial [Acidimicrobiia bacterium]|nr:nucleoside triphosphate pyrophosphohydrolase [Acidimicrobiia bacterium]MDH5502420.1 nucleoside triphosphate pyrophosphohydrolase [Acidimicrobiia bacterium]
MDPSRGHHAASDHRGSLNHRLVIVGVGPGELDRLPGSTRDLLLDPTFCLVVRTTSHPGLAQLAATREVVSGDDLYESLNDFESVYDRLAARVMGYYDEGPVIFAVPGSPSVGEFTVPRIRRLAAARGVPVEVVGAESFIDAVCAEMGIDPLEHGLQVLDGRDLPDPFPLHVPTIIAQVDVPLIAVDVLSRLAELLGDEAPITVVTDAGGEKARIETRPVRDFDSSIASLRTSLVIEPQRPTGWLGVIDIMRTLRRECPWDAEQTHHSLIANLTEEAAELAEALAALPAAGDEPDFGAYADVEEELGDVLLQVIFHVAIGEPSGALRADAVAQTLIAKLTGRHPHVFGDELADNAEDVLEVWERAKAAEKGSRSLFDGVAQHLEPLTKAAKVQERANGVGFDWDRADPVFAKLREEIAELAGAETAEEKLHELGDVLFTVVNLARHLNIGPELALRTATQRFERRLKWMESHGDLAAATNSDLERWWEAAKDNEG